MSCNPWRWLWGLIPVLMLSWVTFQLERPTIENDLTRRANASLDESGLSWASIRFLGRDAVLNGLAPDESSPRRAIEAVRSIWGVRVVRARTDLVDLVNEYTLSAAVRDRQIFLAGHVPNEETRHATLRLIKSAFPEFQIDDSMILARGAPEIKQWLSRIEFAAQQLTLIKRGRVSLTASKLTLTGEAIDASAYKTLSTAVTKKLPEGISSVANEVTPPIADPYLWSAALTGSQLVLSGHVPNEQLREALFTRAKSDFPKTAIVDRMELALGSPEGWEFVAFLALEQLSKLRTGDIALEARGLRIAGDAPDETTAQSVRETLRMRIPESYKLVDNITFPKPVFPVASPFVTTISVAGDTIELTGSAPGEEARSALVAQVKKLFAGKTVADRLQPASGGPEGWQPCMTAGVQTLTRLGGGTVQLVNRKLVLRGETEDQSLHHALPGEMRAKANRACETEAHLELVLPPEPDLTWRATFDAGEIVLDGDVPDAAIKADLVNAAGRIYSGARIVDRMKVVESASSNWKKVAELGLRLVSRLRRGVAVLEAQDLLIRGEVADTASATVVKDTLARDISKSFQGRADLTVRSDTMIWAEEQAKRTVEEEKRRQEAEQTATRRAEEDEKVRQDAARQRAGEEEAARRREREAEEKRGQEQEQERARRSEAEAEAQKCEAVLGAAVKEGVILFDFARASLKPASHATLDRLANIVKDCPSGTIEISGHTDSEGSDDFNLRLSQERAQSVMSYLAGAGINASRMRARGFGEARPVVPNTSQENRAKNRRIEFRVVVE